MKNTFIISIIAFVALSTSCSEYNKVVKSEDYERKLSFANEYYQRGSSPKIKHEGKKNQKEVINSNVLLRSVTYMNKFTNACQKLVKVSCLILGSERPIIFRMITTWLDTILECLGSAFLTV